MKSDSLSLYASALRHQFAPESWLISSNERARQSLGIIITQKGREKKERKIETERRKTEKERKEMRKNKKTQVKKKRRIQSMLRAYVNSV